MRKVIQISQVKNELHALCVDGAILQYRPECSTVWREIPAIPQPEVRSGYAAPRQIGLGDR